MREVAALLLILVCLIGAGCHRESPSAKPAAVDAPFSMSLFDGVVASKINIKVSGKDVQATVFAKDLGRSALFLFYYTLPYAVEESKEGEAAVDQEINRFVTNVSAKVVSRTALSVEGHPALEVIARSPENNSLLIRSRVICASNQIHSLTAITPDNLDPEKVRALDKMFEGFSVK